MRTGLKHEGGDIYDKEVEFEYRVFYIELKELRTITLKHWLESGEMEATETLTGGGENGVPIIDSG